MCCLAILARFSFNERVGLRAQRAMAQRGGESPALLVTGKRGEIDRYVRSSVVGASGDPAWNSGLVAR